MLGLAGAAWQCAALAGLCRASSGKHLLAPWVKVVAAVGFFSPNLNYSL